MTLLLRTDECVSRIGNAGRVLLEEQSFTDPLQRFGQVLQGTARVPSFDNN